MSSRTSGWLGVLLLFAACAAAGGSDRPPDVAPAPSSAAISNLGFDGAVRAGSDDVVASTGVDRVDPEQEPDPAQRDAPAGLRPGSRIVPQPVRATVDPNKGKVQSLEPVLQIPGLTHPATRYVAPPRPLRYVTPSSASEE